MKKTDDRRFPDFSALFGGVFRGGISYIIVYALVPGTPPKTDPKMQLLEKSGISSLFATFRQIVITNTGKTVFFITFLGFSQKTQKPRKKSTSFAISEKKGPAFFFKDLKKDQFYSIFCQFIAIIAKKAKK